MRARWLWLLLGLALVLRAGIRDRGVISDHLEFGRRLVAQEELYAPYRDAKPLHAPYPPSFGLLTAPFALLGERGGRIAWVLLQVATVGWIGAWLLRWLREAAPALVPREQWVLALTALLAGRYLLRDLHGGGGNTFNLGAALGALALAANRREGAAGLLLGFALATKPTQWLFVPLLWLLRHRRAAAYAALAALGFALLAFAIHGFDPAPWRQWIGGTLAYVGQSDPFATPQGGFPPFTWMNQSLRCAVARWFGSVPPELAALVPGFVPGSGWPPGTVQWIARLLALAILATTGIVAWRRRDDAAARLPLAAACLAASLLLSPISWKAHHVALIPALFLLAAHACAGSRAAWIAVVLYLAGCVAGEELTGKELKNLQQSLYIVTLGTLAAWLFALVTKLPAGRRGARVRDAPDA
jgi:hypothetical protein